MEEEWMGGWEQSKGWGALAGAEGGETVTGI